MNALPTETYTVIRVTWATGAREGVEDVLTLHDDGWYDAEGTGWAADSGKLLRSITGFEVLAEPPTYTGNQYAEIQKAQRETAKAVLDRVRQTETLPDWWVDQIANEFGVQP